MDNEFALEADEVALVEADSLKIIQADDTTAEVHRPVTAGEGEFDGPREGPFTFIDRIDVDFVIEPDAEVLEPDSDAIADAPFGSDVEKEDRVVIGGKNYRVRHAKPFRAFGAGTHLRLQLKREY